MRKAIFALFGMIAAQAFATAQGTFEISGTPIPTKLLTQNYGSVTKDVIAYDLNICNITDAKQSIVSSKIYQAITQTDPALEPIGRQIMLASILQSQSHSVSNILQTALGSASGLLSVLNYSKVEVSPAVTGSVALAAFSGQQLLLTLKPMLSADQVEKFESQVLEPALVLDGGSCVERTVFFSAANGAAKAKTQALSFHVR